MSLLNGKVRRLWSDAPGARTCRNPNETLLCQRSADESVELAIRTAFAPPWDAGLRGINAGPLSNSTVADSLTSVLIWINRTYKAAEAGIVLTGIDLERRTDKRRRYYLIDR